MIAKSLAAAAVAVSVAGFSASSAQAGKWDVDVNIGLGGYGAYPLYDDVYYGEGHGHGHHGSWGVTCGEAKWEVKSRHFKKVKALDCGGKTYTFSGWKHGDKYRIKVSRKYGEIISVSAVY